MHALIKIYKLNSSAVREASWPPWPTKLRNLLLNCQLQTMQPPLRLKNPWQLSLLVRIGDRDRHRFNLAALFFTHTHIKKHSPSNAGMAGSGKTTFLQRLNSHMHQNSIPAYIINLDPAVMQLPYSPNIDIRDTVRFSFFRNWRRCCFFFSFSFLSQLN